jgi:phage terminase small subunit
MLLDPVRETFATTYHETGNATEALRTAKPKQCARWKPETVNQEASRWLRDTKISARLQELRAQAAKAHEITIDSIALELEEARKVGKDNGQSGGMVAASMGKAKLVGLLIDKAEVTGRDGGPLVPVLNISLSRPKPRDDDQG